jgi:hypothetical protein
MGLSAVLLLQFREAYSASSSSPLARSSVALAAATLLGTLALRREPESARPAAARAAQTAPRTRGGTALEPAGSARGKGLTEGPGELLEPGVAVPLGVPAALGVAEGEEALLQGGREVEEEQGVQGSLEDMRDPSPGWLMSAE